MGVLDSQPWHLPPVSCSTPLSLLFWQGFMGWGEPCSHWWLWCLCPFLDVWLCGSPSLINVCVPPLSMQNPKPSLSLVSQLWVSLYHEPCPVSHLGSSGTTGPPQASVIHMWTCCSRCPCASTVVEPGLGQAWFPLRGQWWSWSNTIGTVCLKMAMQSEWRGLEPFALPLGETNLMGGKEGKPSRPSAVVFASCFEAENLSTFSMRCLQKKKS